MRFTQLTISGAQIIDPNPHRDERGYFSRTWCLREFAEKGIPFVPQQANSGLSFRKGTIRGMHFQVEPALEAKLVRCTRGSMFDVVLDLRPGSPTYGQWYGAELTPQNGRMLFLPEGCAHGYQTLEDNTEMYYMASMVYTPSAARGVRYDDPAFSIRWPLPLSSISDQDRNWPYVCCKTSIPE